MISKKTTFKAPLSFQNQTMAYFYSQIEQQRQVLQCVKTVLPTDLADQVRYCLIKNKKLRIYTDSAVWASQLRFYHAVILASIAPLVETVQIKVITQQAGFVVSVERETRLPCPEKIEQMRNDSLSIADESLKRALLKLSTTLARLSNEASSK